MELEGRKELVVTGKSSRTWSVPTVSLRPAILNVFQGFFRPKLAVFGPKMQFLKLRCATCESRSRAPPLSFLLKLCVIVLHIHRYHPPKFHPNAKQHDGILIFSHFARAACCLLAAAAKPGRSTLDTKKGYKTKTGSTSSLTLTLTIGYYINGIVPAAHWWLSGNVKLGLIWGSAVHCDVFELVCCVVCMLGNVHFMLLEILDAHLVKVQEGGDFFWRQLS